MFYQKIRCQANQYLKNIKVSLRESRMPKKKVNESMTTQSKLKFEVNIRKI